MNYLAPKYFKKAAKSLGISLLVKGMNDIDDLNKYIDTLKLNIDVLEGNLEIAQKNIKTAKKNIDILKGHLVQYKEQLESKELIYMKGWVCERINEVKDTISEMEDIVFDAQKTISENPKKIETLQNALNNYFYMIEPQMRIERTMDLNRGKNYQYSYV